MESGSGKPPPQKKQKPASGGRRLELDIDQVLVFNDPREPDPHELSGAQRIALITRLATASRSAGLNAGHVLTDDDLRHMELFSHLDEPETSQYDVEHDVELIIAQDSNGDFSQDECQIIRRMPVATREILTIRTSNRSGWNFHDGKWNLPCIHVYGLVHDLVVRVSIYLTQYRNVIGIDVPQTPDLTASLYTIHIDTVAKFLTEYFDKTPNVTQPITVVLDNSDGSDTEAY
jgi:hypothetical protein